ncbi:MAG: polysaccharide deacetylase family protein [Candidatus Brocadiia bacterium]
MTLYVAAYDTESPECVEALPRIVEVHHEYGMPGTFFVTGEVLEGAPERCRELLDDPLFEVASHTYSHVLVADHPFCGRAASAEAVRADILEGKAWVERAFEQPCRGLRFPCCFPDGLEGKDAALEAVEEAGFDYVSSVAWGKDFSLPAPVNEPSTYAGEGRPDLWELPAHGWHENLLKNHNGLGPRRLTLWPPESTELIPSDFIRTPEEEFDINRRVIESALEGDATFVSLIWHPWSLRRMDPDMRMLEMTFEFVAEAGLQRTTYAGLWDQLRDGRD